MSATLCAAVYVIWHATNWDGWTAHWWRAVSSGRSWPGSKALTSLARPSYSRGQPVAQPIHMMQMDADSSFGVGV